MKIQMNSFLVILALSYTVSEISSLSHVSGSTNTKSSNSYPKVRRKRNVFQFGKMIEFKTLRPALTFNRYGNHCGWASGSAPVVDGIDRCCYVHDRCYHAAYTGICSNYKLWSSMITYAWTIRRNEIVCQSSKECPLAVCECDKEAATCFAENKYNPVHKKPSLIDILLRHS